MLGQVRKRLGRALDWWGKRQIWWWLLVGAVSLAWFGYDVGQMVTRAGLVSLGAPTEGAMTTDQMVAKAEKSNGGRLIITSPNSARFIDRTGGTWEVADFGDTVTRDDLHRLRDARVQLDGEVSVDVNAVKTSPRDLLFATLMDLGVKITFIAFYGFFMYFLLRQARGGEKRFRKLGNGERPNVRIQDVAGYEGPKREVTEVVDYLRDPARFARVGARPPRGVLLYGPPGTGKTLIAKAIAGEAAAAFFEQSAASFVKIYAGAGASSVRSLFAAARRSSPSVIFIDELDAVGGTRGGVGTHDEREQTLNQLLVEMDGFEDAEGVIVIAATNRLESLDPALLRPKRFDRKVYIGKPSRADRVAILERHAQALPSLEAHLEFWANQTPGFVGADLEALVNEAAIEAARANRGTVTDADFAAARDRVLIGARDHSRRMTPDERRTVAGHELGHAIMRLKGGGQVEKVSILPRGQALGVTVTTQEEERVLQTEAYLRAELGVLMGGRAAEQVLFGKVTTGAADDIERASHLAREAVRRFGGDPQRGPYLPQAAALQEKIEEAAATWVHTAYDAAIQILTEHKSVLEKLLSPLVEQEEMDGAVIAQALGLTQPAPGPLEGETPMLALSVDKRAR
jgi:cell division protease FtsH